MKSTKQQHWRTNLSRALIGALAVQASMAQSFIAAPIAQAADQDIVLNELANGSDAFVELYNRGNAEVDLADWTISATEGLLATLDGTIDPGERAVFWLDDDGDRHQDTVSLRSAAGTTVDTVSYGTNTWATLPEPSLGGALARETDGANRWVSNAAPTPHFSNAATGTPRVTSLSVAETDLNPTGMINAATESAADIALGLDRAAAHVTVVAFDAMGDSVDETVDGSSDTELTLNARTLEDGPLTLRAYAESPTGVMSAWTSAASAHKDTVAPDAPAITTPTAPVVTGSDTATITGMSPADSTLRLYRDGMILTTKPGGQFSVAAPLTLGLNALTATAADAAWNESDAVALPLITRVTGTVPEAPINDDGIAVTGPDQIIDEVRSDQLWLKTSAETVAGGEIFITNYDSTNPVGTNVAAGTPVGSYYDVSATNASIFPLEIKIYYTAEDLENAGVTSESQLLGLYYYNGTSWKQFANTAVYPADVRVNGKNFSGYVRAITTHLTPMVIVADTKAPAKPANLTATAKHQAVHLSWEPVADAAGYMVRYRPATNVDTAPYASVFLADGQASSFDVTDLANGTLYEFGVAAEDAAGNLGSYAVVEQTPTGTGPTSDFVTPAHAERQPAVTLAGVDAIGGPVNAVFDESVRVTQAPAGNDTGVDGQPVDGDDAQGGDGAADDGDIRGGTDEGETEDSRSLVTILIIVIAAAAGFGGYYAYQWWTAKPEDSAATTAPKNEPPASKGREKPTKRSERSGRW